MVGQTIGGRYELEELIGAGGMSSVYRAHDVLLERSVAIKVLLDSYLDDEETIERFRREARAVAQLSHPNIVTVIDRGEEDGRQYIVFEYVDGENLKQHVDRRGALPVGGALAIAVDVGRGLAFAHRQGIVHRDVKPQNVLMNGDGRPKVTDFGIARSLDVEKGVTQTGAVLGTSDYIAPEQAGGTAVSDRTDVYSLGVVVYELLTGEVPFPGESFVAVALKHMHEPPPSVLDRRPDVPARVATAVERAMAKDPADRFSSMDEFVGELEACLDELGRPEGDRTMIVPPRVVRESRPRPARARRSVWPLLALVGGLAAIAAVAALVLLWDPAGEAVGVDAGGGGGGGGDGGAQQAVQLQGVASFDPPPGDGQEHPERVGDAVDRDPATYWTTESYDASLGALGKEGVGLVVDAGEPRSLAELTVRTDTPGFTAEIRAGGSPEGPFDSVVGEARTVEGETTFELEGEEARYYVVWITELPGGGGGVAHVNEVAAR